MEQNQEVIASAEEIKRELQALAKEDGDTTIFDALSVADQYDCGKCGKACCDYGG